MDFFVIARTLKRHRKRPAEICEIIKEFEPETKNMLVRDAECLVDIDNEIKLLKENQKTESAT